jgi:hypothetical protein
MRRRDVLAVVPGAVATEVLARARVRDSAAWWLGRLKVAPISAEEARVAGTIARQALGRLEVTAADAQLVLHAAQLGADILTTDENHIRALVRLAGLQVRVL